MIAVRLHTRSLRLVVGFLFNDDDLEIRLLCLSHISQTGNQIGLCSKNPRDSISKIYLVSVEHAENILVNDVPLDIMTIQPDIIFEHIPLHVYLRFRRLIDTFSQQWFCPCNTILQVAITHTEIVTVIIAGRLCVPLKRGFPMIRLDYRYKQVSTRE